MFDAMGRCLAGARVPQRVHFSWVDGDRCQIYGTIERDDGRTEVAVLELDMGTR